MKRIKVLLSVMFIMMFMIFALGSGEESTVDQGSGTVGESETGKKDAEKENTNGTIGDYSVVIDSCRLAKDFEGDPVVIVKYIYKNVSGDDAASFLTAFETTVYQDGVGLNESWFVDDSANYESDNQSKEIKKGASLEVEVAYELNDKKTDIEVEVKEWLGFDDTTVKKTFSIKK